MSRYDQKLTGAIISIVSVLVSDAAFANGGALPVPEPGMFGLVAAGVVGVLLSARIARR